MAGVQFTYGITRSYPYRWFKWVIVVGAAVLIAIVSIFNLANNGYTLRPEYTTDPNSTVAHRPWAQKLAAMDNKNAASCQSQNLPVNTEYYTDKQSLAYTIANVWQVDSEERIHTLPSLRYINNSIQSCTLGMIQLDYENADRPAAEIGWITWVSLLFVLYVMMVINANVGVEHICHGTHLMSQLNPPNPAKRTVVFLGLGHLHGTQRPNNLCQLDCRLQLRTSYHRELQCIPLPTSSRAGGASQSLVGGIIAVSQKAHPTYLTCSRWPADDTKLLVLAECGCKNAQPVWRARHRWQHIHSQQRVHRYLHTSIIL